MFSPKRILVRGPNWIGDYVMAADFFAALRAQYPAARITLACPAEISALAAQSGWFDEILSLSRAQRKLPSAWRYWATAVAAREEELAFSLVASFSAALLLRLARIPTRWGVAEPSAQFFLTQSQIWRGRDAGKPKVQLYRDLFALVTGQPAPELATAPSSTKREGIVLAPGASIALREWPGFVELGQRLRVLYPQTPIWVVGSPAQENWAEKFAALSDPGFEVRIGKTSLPELVELCGRARFVVANDSGVAHLAASLAGAPTVVVFGPGDPAYVVPRGPRVAVARAEGVPCSPCEKPRCHARFGYQQCLRALGVDAVLAQIATLD